MKAKLGDLNGFLKENKNKIGGFGPIGGRMESMVIASREKEINTLWKAETFSYKYLWGQKHKKINHATTTNAS